MIRTGRRNGGRKEKYCLCTHTVNIEVEASKKPRKITVDKDCLKSQELSINDHNTANATPMVQ